MRNIFGTCCAALCLVLVGCGGSETEPVEGAPSVAPEEPVVGELGLPLERVSLPEPAEFARAAMGKQIDVLGLTITDACIGNFDGFSAQYVGERRGVSGNGWAWDLSNEAPFQGIVVIDANGVLVGASDEMAARPDVVESRPEQVTNEQVGWIMYAGAEEGTLRVFGVDPETSTACQVGMAQIPG